jgi:tRNA1(Val) A37 N6-methylase TrmN6
VSRHVLWRTHLTDDGRVEYVFCNDLVVTAQVAEMDHYRRILPLTRLQGALLSYLLRAPSIAYRKQVFEPFAGAGALGFMALSTGAKSVDFLDINPRAQMFQRETAIKNGFSDSILRHYTADLAAFEPIGPYDLILANPPFLPTPDCIPGTLTSNGGSDGNRLLSVLLRRLPQFLQPGGEAFVILFQILVRGVPLAALQFADELSDRDVEFVALQERAVPFTSYVQAYTDRYPSSVTEITEWARTLVRDLGPDLSLCHYIMHVGARADGTGDVRMLFDGVERFGSQYVMPADDPDLIPVDGRRR